MIVQTFTSAVFQGSGSVEEIVVQTSTGIISMNVNYLTLLSVRGVLLSTSQEADQGEKQTKRKAACE